jgi:hypothetical protein
VRKRNAMLKCDKVELVVAKQHKSQRPAFSPSHRRPDVLVLTRLGEGGGSVGDQMPCTHSWFFFDPDDRRGTGTR